MLKFREAISICRDGAPHAAATFDLAERRCRDAGAYRWADRASSLAAAERVRSSLACATPQGGAHAYVILRDPDGYVHAGNSFADALAVLQPDEGWQLCYAIVEARDAGAARLTEPSAWQSFRWRAGI